jgi:hypothetical protein
MTNITQSPFVRSSWQFPEDDPQELAVQLDRSYIALANGINARDIGMHPTSSQVATGQKWALSSGKLASGLRRIYYFTAAGNVAHGIGVTSNMIFTNCYGSYTDGTNWYGVQFAKTPAADQVAFYISPTNIVIQADAGAPTISSGVIVLEWIV